MKVENTIVWNQRENRQHGGSKRGGIIGKAVRKKGKKMREEVIKRKGERDKNQTNKK